MATIPYADNTPSIMSLTFLEIRRRLNSTEAQTSGKESSKVELPLHMLYLSSSTCVPPADNDHFI